MPLRKSPCKGVYAGLSVDRLPRKRPRLHIFIFGAVLLLLLFSSALYLRKLSSEIAMSDAVDAVTLAINDSVAKVMEKHDYSYEDYVSLEKDNAGNITAITTNTTRINALSAEILKEIVSAADNQKLDIRIPLGNLLGSNLLLGRGPEIPVEILMLTSSFVRFDNDLISTGINQSKHVITLRAEVDVDILIPWATVSAAVDSDIMIAETVIVGRVPETYVSVTEDSYGSN